MNFTNQHETNLQLRNAYPVKTGKRFISFFIDFVLFTVVAYLLSLGFLPLMKSTSAYQNAETSVQEEIRYYNRYIEDTHLVSFVDEEKTERKDSDVLVFENMAKAIYLSYKTFEENSEKPQYSDYVIKEDSKLAQYGTSSLTNDDVSYFYTVYVPSVQNTEKHPGTIIAFQGNNTTLFVNNLYKNSAMGEFFSYGEMNAMPVMYSNISYSLFVYLTEKKSDVNESVYNAGESYYSTFYSAYHSMLQSAETLCIKDEPYYSTHYVNYRNQIALQGKMLNIGLLISLILSYLVSILLPKLIFRRGQTVGRKCLGLYLTDPDGENAKWYVQAVHSVLGIFGYLPVTFLLYLFPPFKGVYDPLFTPFLGNVALLWFIAVPAFLVMANYIPSLFFAERETLLEMVFKVRLKDKNNIGEAEDREIESGRSY